uniref:(northern house mosquito) hypothetical protein n=1 Tax=Culex pipiens TaxID=7175 RepID=A0A8D8BVR4_CULPI
MIMKVIIMLVPLGEPFSLDSGPLFTLDSDQPADCVRVRRQISQSTHTRGVGACLPFRSGVVSSSRPPIAGDPQSAADDRRGPLCVRAPKDCALFTLTSTARAPDIPGEIRQTPKLESSTDFTSIFLTPKINFSQRPPISASSSRNLHGHRVSGVYSKKLAVVRGFNQFLNHPKSYGLIISTYAHCTYNDVDTHGFAHIHSHGHIFFEWIDFIRFFFLQLLLLR